MKGYVLVTALGSGLAVLAAGGVAGAQYEPQYEPQYAPEYEYKSPVRPSVFAADAPQPHRPDLISPIGVSAMLGGAVTGFTAEDARDSTDTGGGWNARLIVGTRSMIAGELAYVGTIQDVNALGLDSDAQLLGNGGELVARVNFLPGMFQPYVFGGAAYVHYNLVNDDFNTSSINDSDNVVQFPVGAGLTFRYEGLVVDGRGAFRPTADADLFGDDSKMHTWSANLNAGFEF